MNSKAICLTITLLLTSSPQVFGDAAADQIQLRYGDLSGNVKLSVRQKIQAGDLGTKRNMRAGRIISLELELKEQDGAVLAYIEKAKANYTAHEMTQRLPTSSLVGQSIKISKTGNGQAIQRTNPDQDLLIGVGQIIGGDYPVGLALVDILPVLPEGPVKVGTTWATTQDTLSLEGWAWASGNLDSQHTVTGVDQLNTHTIVSVISTAQARLGNVDGGLKYSGDGELNRTSSWRFDATDGRLLSLRMEQDTSGINTMPQGEVGVRQHTIVEYKTLE